MEGSETGWQPGGRGRDVQDRPRGPGWSGPTYLAILPFTPFPSPITALQTHGPSHCFLSKLGFFCHRLLLHPLEHMTAVFWALELTLLSLPQGRYSVSVLVTFSTFVALGTIALKLLTVLLVVCPPHPYRDTQELREHLVHYGVPNALLMAQELFMEWINKCMS